MASSDPIEAARAAITAEQGRRARVADRMHDELAQMLAAARMKMSLVRAKADPALQVSVDGALKALDAGLDVVRDLVAELAPPSLRNLGVGRALRWLARDAERRRSGPVTLDVPAELD